MGKVMGRAQSQCPVPWPPMPTCMPHRRTPMLAEVLCWHLRICMAFFSSVASSPCCRVPIFRSSTHGTLWRHVRFSRRMNSGNSESRANKPNKKKKKKKTKVQETKEKIKKAYDSTRSLACPTPRNTTNKRLQKRVQKTKEKAKKTYDDTCSFPCSTSVKYPSTH